MWKFDEDTFWDEFDGGGPLVNRIQAVFARLDSDWTGRPDIDYIDNGVKFITGPDQSSLVTVKVTVVPTTGDLSFDVGPTTGKYMPRELKGKPSPWSDPDIQEDIEDILLDYVVEDKGAIARQRGREAKGLMSVVKPGEEGLEVGKTYLPPGIPATIGSFLTGEKGSLKQQTATLKAKATGTGRRKTRKSKTRAFRRTSLGRKTRQK